jgi:hypothetical protein
MSDHVEPSWVDCVERLVVERWFWDHEKLVKRIQSYIAIFAKTEGLPTLANMQRSLFWKTHKRRMTPEQQEVFTDIWESYSVATEIKEERLPDIPRPGQRNLFGE